jgi:hypothetical protein
MIRFVSLQFMFEIPVNLFGSDDTDGRDDLNIHTDDLAVRRPKPDGPPKYSTRG